MGSDEMRRWLEEDLKQNRLEQLPILSDDVFAESNKHSRYVAEFVGELRKWLKDGQKASRYSVGLTGFEVFVDDDRAETVRLEPMRIPQKLTRPLDLSGVQTYFNRKWLQKQYAAPRDMPFEIAGQIAAEVIMPIYERCHDQSHKEAEEFKATDNQAEWLHDAFIRVWEDMMPIPDDVEFMISKQPPIMPIGKPANLINYSSGCEPWYIKIQLHGVNSLGMVFPQYFPGEMVHGAIEGLIKAAFPELACAMKLE
jgi:hypothetical protein